MISINNNVMITIAIPFYNAEKYLVKAIDSVIWQTYQDFKLILLDDGSRDSSLTIAQSYAAKDNRIIVISDGQNKNLGFRLNQIPYLVDTKYLARMDADDIMHPQKIEKQIKTLENNPQIDVLGTNAYSIDENDYVIGIRVKPSDKSLRKVNSFIHPTIVAKTDWFKKNPYNVQAVRVEDIELWMRTSEKYNFEMLNEPLFFYREFGGGYYKKYMKSIPSLGKMVLNNNFKIKYILFFLKTLMSTIVYFLYSKLQIENKLILGRNEVLLNPKKYQDYV